jgi:hypothetical protein
LHCRPLLAGNDPDKLFFDHAAIDTALKIAD